MRKRRQTRIRLMRKASAWIASSIAALEAPCVDGKASRELEELRRAREGVEALLRLEAS